MGIFKNVLLVLLGMAITVGLFCLVIGIGCAVNGLQFGEQISQWFGHSTPVEDVIPESVKALIHLPI